MITLAVLAMITFLVIIIFSVSILKMIGRKNDEKMARNFYSARSRSSAEKSGGRSLTIGFRGLSTPRSDHKSLADFANTAHGEQISRQWEPHINRLEKKKARIEKKSSVNGIGLISHVISKRSEKKLKKLNATISALETGRKQELSLFAKMFSDADPSVKSNKNKTRAVPRLSPSGETKHGIRRKGHGTEGFVARMIIGNSSKKKKPRRK